MITINFKGMTENVTHVNRNSDRIVFLVIKVIVWNVLEISLRFIQIKEQNVDVTSIIILMEIT